MNPFDSDNAKLLVSALTRPRNEHEMRIFLEDLLTAQEIVEIARRMRVAKLLYEHTTYDEIARLTGASTATISRVNRCIRFGEGGYENVLEQMTGKEEPN